VLRIYPMRCAITGGHDVVGGQSFATAAGTGVVMGPWPRGEGVGAQAAACMASHSAARSATIRVGALVLPLVMVGMMLASTTRKP
jgi:hypothetical protein